MSDVYERLAEFMDVISPIGFPKTEKGIILLKHLFSPEQAEIVLCMTSVPEAPETIIKRCTKNVNATPEMIEAIYIKGLIQKHTEGGSVSYAALSFGPGIYENIITTKTDPKAMALISEVFAEDALKMFANRTVGVTRAIPVETSVPPGSKVRPFEQLSEMIGKAPEPIVVLDCMCRSNKENACDAPLEVCLVFGDHGQFFLDTKHIGRQIDREEALKVLKTAEDAGLVHQAINFKDDELMWLCNCCGCCCLTLGTINLLDPDGKITCIEPSDFMASVNNEACVGCGICIDRCQTRAVTMEDDVPFVKPERCIGCGLCVSTCPEEAITLIKRPDDQLPNYPETFEDLCKKSYKSRQYGE